jgi:hypothetical protein
MELKELATIICLGAGIISLIFINYFQPLAIIPLILGLFAYLFSRWGHLYLPILQGKRNIKDKFKVEMSNSGDAIYKEKGLDYVATIYMKLDVYETMTNKTEQDILEYSSYFERVVSTIKDPIKITTIIHDKDMKSYITQIDNEKIEIENMLAKERKSKKPNPVMIEVLERKKLMWDRRLDSLYKNEIKPRAVEYIIAVSGKGTSSEAAISQAKIKAREIKSNFKGGMNINVDEMRHERLKFCYEWEYLSQEW